MINNKEKSSSYEVLFITKKDDKEKIKNLAGEISRVGEIEKLSVELWKETKLAYKIKDIDDSENALYFLVKFDCQKQVLKLVDNLLRSNESIRRYRILNLERDSKKMKVGRIQNPKPRIRKRPASNFSRERGDYKSRVQPNRDPVNNS